MLGAYYAVQPSMAPVDAVAPVGAIAMGATESGSAAAKNAMNPMAFGIWPILLRGAGGYVVGKHIGLPVAGALVSAFAPMPIVVLAIMAHYMGRQ